MAIASVLKIAGVDEAGRGPLAGPVIAAAVILDPGRRIPGLADSKQLTEKKREELYLKITARAWAYGIGRAEVEEIDRDNIHHATLLAMQRAVAALNRAPHEIWVDGLFCPSVPIPSKAIPHGDTLVRSIMAASILAKVVRDHEMVSEDARYPGYGFAQHKGYGTPQHLKALKILGATPLHRRTFAPVRAVCDILSKGGSQSDAFCHVQRDICKILLGAE